MLDLHVKKTKTKTKAGCIFKIDMAYSKVTSIESSSENTFSPFQSMRDAKNKVSLDFLFSDNRAKPGLWTTKWLGS